VNDSAPVYLSSYFTRVADVPSRLRLRSSTSNQLVPSYNIATVGRRAFPVSAANLWNSLPAHLTSAPSLTVFRQRLKTFLFRRSYPDLIIWYTELTFCCGPSSNFVTQVALKMSLMMIIVAIVPCIIKFTYGLGSHVHTYEWECVSCLFTTTTAL